jgi:5-(carboxyamino)imidazole ribonucleotide synthase
MTTLAPGATIGILGGGQLGRMLAVAAAELGFDVHIYTDEIDSPASRVAARTTIASYDDAAALAAFAAQVDAVTFEFENVPAAAGDALLAVGAVVRPHPGALATGQDRLVEKRFLNDNGVATTPFLAIDAAADIAPALAELGAPALLKTRRFGYDGKGQSWVGAASEAASAWAAIGAQPAILEAAAPFVREVSVIAARGHDGAVVAFDVCENRHANGILAETLVPAQVEARAAEQARDSVFRLMTALNYVGVLTVEFFALADGGLLANEIAPRVHNSGHWTLDGASHSQFDLQIRAVAGWPLPQPTTLGPVRMINLIGDDVAEWAQFAADPRARLHLYGKRAARPGRKMGHVTYLSDC